MYLLAESTVTHFYTIVLLTTQSEENVIGSSGVSTKKATSQAMNEVLSL